MYPINKSQINTLAIYDGWQEKHHRDARQIVMSPYSGILQHRKIVTKSSALYALPVVSGLPRSVTAVHAQIAASHKAACIANQENRGTTVLSRERQTAQHVLFGPLGAALGELDKQVLDHLGDNISGGNGVDADVVLAPFGGQVAAQLDDAGLGSVVGSADEAL